MRLTEEQHDYYWDLAVSLGIQCEPGLMFDDPEFIAFIECNAQSQQNQKYLSWIAEPAN